MNIAFNSPKLKSKWRLFTCLGLIGLSISMTACGPDGERNDSESPDAEDFYPEPTYGPSEIEDGEVEDPILEDIIIGDPGDGIYIKLTWEAEAVGEAAQGRGTDLDLHYLHPLGQWDRAPYSVNWRHRRADWGTSSSPSVAIMALDDRHGVGPEVITHSNPEPDLSYAVGVFYFTDNGFGPADATIQIYIDGELRHEREMRLPATGYFWNVGLIEWPSGNLIPNDEVQVGFP